MLCADCLQRERVATSAGRDGPGSGDRLRRGRSGRHLGPACEGSEEHRRVRPRRGKTRRSGQARREDDARHAVAGRGAKAAGDRKSTRLNSSHLVISYAVFCLKKKKKAALVYWQNSG